jgi:predicted RNase H-like HicB family nuclease
MTKQFKIIIEKHSDGYIAFPIGIEGVVVGEGDTYEDALKDVQSAIKFHIETFGKEIVNSEPKILDAYLTETQIEI